MAWDDEMPTILRALLQDKSATPVYSDDGLVEVLLIAGRQLELELAFANTYAISVTNGSLKPDPTATATRDDAFVMLSCYLAAVTLIRAELRGLARQGISIQDGDSKISLQRSPQSLAHMLRAYEDQYDAALYAFRTGGPGGLGEVIVTPYPYYSEPWVGGFPYEQPVARGLRDGAW